MKNFILFLFILFTVSTKAQEGFPDPSFGYNGYVPIPGPGTPAFQSNGKLVRARASQGALVIERYTADGLPDPSFGNGGIATTDFSSSFQNLGVRGVAVQDDGKIVVGAQGFTRLNLAGRSDPVYFLVRYRSDGSLDPGFGFSGVRQNIITQQVTDLEQVHVQKDGRVIEVLWFARPGGNNFIINRYDPAGISVVTFRPPPIPQAPLPPVSGYHANSLIIQNDGKILVGALANTFSTLPRYLLLFRFNSDGTPDASFGTNGVVKQLDMIGTTPENLALQRDGKIIMESQNILYRFSADGVLDPSFGNGGKLVSPFDVHRLLTQDDDKIITAGNFTAFGSTGHFLLARYEPNGNSFDPSFAYGGMTAIAFAPTRVDVEIMTLANNRIYVYGNGYLAAFQLSSSPMAANPVTGVQSRARAERISDQKLHAIVSPNPATTHFVLRLQGNSNKPMQIRIYDAVGKTVELKGNITPNGTLRLGDSYRPGLYYAEVVQGSEKITIKLIKGSR